jgi:nucleoside-triphosphatase THEP1
VTSLIILTGDRGIGKSTICRRVVALAQSAGWSCGGIITLSRGDARDVLDVGSGDVRRLTQSPDTARTVDQGRFRFNPRVLRWAGQRLHQATPCDLLVIDEIGPLELERGKGWANALDVLAGGGFGLALVVVRPELVARARAQLPNYAPVVFSATRENRDQLPATLVSALG